MPEDAPDHRHVGPRPHPNILIGVRGRASETRVNDDQRRVVPFLCLEDVLACHRVPFRRVAADQEDRTRIPDVRHAVGHRAVAPGVGHTSDRGRMADTRLMIGVVGAPEGGELAEQVCVLIAHLGRAHPINRIGTRLLADLQHLVADFVDRLIPRNPLPLSAHQLCRVPEPPSAVGVVAHRCPLGAVGAIVERAVEARLLADPHAALDFRHDRAADGAVGTDRFHGPDVAALLFCLRLGLLDHLEIHRRRSGDAAGD